MSLLAKRQSAGPQGPADLPYTDSLTVHGPSKTIVESIGRTGEQAHRGCLRTAHRHTCCGLGRRPTPGTDSGSRTRRARELRSRGRSTRIDGRNAGLAGERLRRRARPGITRRRGRCLRVRSRTGLRSRRARLMTVVRRSGQGRTRLVRCGIGSRGGGSDGVRGRGARHRGTRGTVVGERFLRFDRCRVGGSGLEGRAMTVGSRGFAGRTRTVGFRGLAGRPRTRRRRVGRGARSRRDRVGGARLYRGRHALGRAGFRGTVPGGRGGRRGGHGTRLAEGQPGVRRSHGNPGGVGIRPKEEVTDDGKEGSEHDLKAIHNDLRVKA